MGKSGRKLPAWLDGPASSAFRAVLSLPLAAGAFASSAAAENLGRSFARFPFNRTRLDRARANLRQAFPSWEADHVEACAANAYEHLFRLGIEFLFSPRLLSEDGWPRCVSVLPHAAPCAPGMRPITDALNTVLGGRPCVMLTGHCGNWEILGHSIAALGFPMHALYRPLDYRALDRWVRDTRQRHGVVLVDKFGAAERLPKILAAGEQLGFVADQNAGDRGLFVPYFGRLASTYKTIGLIAMQFETPVICAMARRLPATEPGLAFLYRLELADIIYPEDWQGRPDPLFYLTARYRRALEQMVRAAPEQYLWMHRIWKSRPRHERVGKPFPAALKEKLRSLPWLSEAEVDALVDRSDRDARFLAETGTDRL